MCRRMEIDALIHQSLLLAIPLLSQNHLILLPLLLPCSPPPAMGWPALIPVEDGGCELHERSLPPAQGDSRGRIQ